MPSRPSANVVGKYLEFDPAFAERVQAFADGRGETFRAVVMHALERHLMYPPPPPGPKPPPEVLPDSPAAGPKGRKKK